MMKKISTQTRIEAGCEGKRRYDSFEAASAGIQKKKVKHGLPKAMAPYHCSFCHHFHVGAKGKTTRKPIKETP